MKQNKKVSLHPSSNFSYNHGERFSGRREPLAPCPSRTTSRLVPLPDQRSKSIHRALSLEDLYKAMPERNLESLREKKTMFTVGIDWASDHHDIAIVDEDGAKLSAFRIEHNTQGLHLLRDKLRGLNVPKEEIIIGIETHRLLIVEFLLNEGFHICSINPKAIDRYRDRYTASQSKSDAFDAEIIAQALRTDPARFRRLVPDTQLLRELRILVQDQQRLIRTQTRFLNQLQACLKDYYPVALELFDNFDSSVALEYLSRYPQVTPVPAKKLEKFLRAKCHPNAQLKAREISKKISEPQIFVEEFTVRAKSRMLSTLVEQLLSLRARIREYQKEIDQLFDRHPDSGLFKSLPGAGERNAPRLLTEIGDNRDKHSDADSLQCEAGTSPVTRSSGKIRTVMMRRACRLSFRNTMHQFSFCTLTQSGWSKTFYDQQKAKGKTHASALRSLGDKWLKIIHHLWQKKISYDENIYLASRMRHQLQEISDHA